VRVRRKGASLEDDAAGPNYALRLTEAAAAEGGSQENFALRLSAALEAIQSAQDGPAAEVAAQPPTAPVEKAPRSEGALSTYLTVLDKLPPIRLPIGPAIPWRIALPALVVLVALMFFLNRPTALAQPAVQARAVPTAMPADSLADLQARQIINASSSTAQVDTLTPAQPETTTALAPETTPPAQPTPAAAQPLGVPDPGGLGFDFVDLGVKLAAVLGLAYGSLLLLKKVGVGGSGVRGPGGTGQGMQVVSSLVLAPNRSVHVLKVPGGKTLLVGVTPTQVNLIADLGETATC
jgi:flagellar biogenesis protein FliO